MKRAVEFYSEGFKLVGDVYVPDGLPSGEQRAAVLLCHGYTGVKDLYLPDNAKTLNDAGYVVMTRLTELVASRLRDTRDQLRWLQSG